MTGLTHVTEQKQFMVFSENQPLPASRRLIVILPDATVDLNFLSRQIWNLAVPDQREVLLMSCPCREENEFPASMNLITLTAILRDSGLSIQTKLVSGEYLERAAGRYAHPDDIFVCFEAHQVKRFAKNYPLSEILARETHLPVCTLNGIIHEVTPLGNNRLASLKFLALCLLSMILFFAIEVWINQNAAGSFRKVLELLVVGAEVLIISNFASWSYRI
jgi:hypothetical protein